MAYLKLNSKPTKTQMGTRRNIQNTLLLTPHAFIYNLCLMLVLSFIGCYRDGMRNQPKHKPLDESTFFADGRSARPLVEGTVARGHLRIDEHFYSGKLNTLD